MSKPFVILTFTALALIWTFVHSAPPKEACVLDDEIDICPGNMTCQLDGSGHPYCHIPGNPVPNSHCLTEGEYEPYLLEMRDFEGHEECEPFTKPCSNKYICCRTHHGHRCFPEESAATSMATEIDDDILVHFRCHGLRLEIDEDNTRYLPLPPTVSLNHGRLSTKSQHFVVYEKKFRGYPVGS